MQPLRIKDNSSMPREELVERVPRLAERLADKTLDQLEREGIFVFPSSLSEIEDLEGEQMILQGVNSSYRTGNVMGFLGCGNERLVIESRFAASEGDFFLHYLLSRVLGLPNLFDMEVDSDPNKKIFELLVFLFPRYLKNALRKGIFKTYLRVDYNDSDPRGAIDVARHIKKNLPFTGKIAYSRREQSYDNSMTQLIRHTAELIKTRKYGRALLNSVKDEVQRIVEVTPSYRLHDRRRVVSDNKKHEVAHAYFREYRELQRLCLLILQGYRHGIGRDSERIYGVLFDGAWLWEEYLHTLVNGLFYHPKNKAHQGAHSLFCGGAGRIYPDFLGKDAADRVIADAKYKPMGNIGNGDYFQILAYMMRFNAKKGVFLYPDAYGTETHELNLQSGCKYDGTEGKARREEAVVKLGLRIPQNASGYGEFSDSMRESEDNFIEFFRKHDCFVKK
jgi:5-methylcytosine-specific restriction endonuclease McrBC regulatory subunit McrC